MAERRPALPALEALHTPTLAEFRAGQGIACLARPQKVAPPASPIIDIAFAQNHDT